MIEIFNEDCLERMKQMDDASVDCIVCDLPYYKIVKNDFDNQWKSEAEYFDWLSQIIDQYKRIIKPNGNLFLFTSRQFNRKICNMLDKWFTEKRIIIWCRKRNFNNTRGNALASGYEPICYYTNGIDNKHGVFNNIKIKPETTRKEYVSGILKDGISLSDVWSDIPALPHNAKEKTPHPTQKPLALMKRIIAIGTNEGDVVLDNCMGSGTTGVACIDLKRNFIGIENNLAYFEIAKNRLTNSENQKTL